MTTSKAFEIFLDNLKVDDYEQIGNRYHEITKKLNKTFRNTESETDNCLQVGSYGRYTGIKGISDLDMLYIMPNSKWDDYKSDPSKLLGEVEDALVKRYPTTDIKVDRLVVDVFFQISPLKYSLYLSRLRMVRLFINIQIPTTAVVTRLLNQSKSNKP